MWYFSSLTRDQTWAPSLGAQSLNQLYPQGSPSVFFVGNIICQKVQGYIFRQGRRTSEKKKKGVAS